ncbi:MAG: DUF488 domain-containing protein [Chloroflexi bacterium]|nr:DUF488 domain-containing protein [Chloroflexota bacterium]
MTSLPIFTIGYGAREIDAFIIALKTYEITYLIDVRSKPYSRYKPDFSKQTLENHLQQNNIRYLFMGDTLGGQPDDLSCYSDGKVDYEKVGQKSFYVAGIGRLQKAHKQGLRVALMCSEGKPEMCHRSKLIGKTLAAEGIIVAHIDESDQIITQEDVVLRLSKGQPSLFDDFFQYTSRKRYVDDKEGE